MKKKLELAEATILELYNNPSKIREQFWMLNPDSHVKASAFAEHSEAFLKKLPKELVEEYMEIVCQRAASDQSEYDDMFVHAFNLGLRLAVEALFKEED